MSFGFDTPLIKPVGLSCINHAFEPGLNLFIRLWSCIYIQNIAILFIRKFAEYTPFFCNYFPLLLCVCTNMTFHTAFKSKLDLFALIVRVQLHLWPLSDMVEPTYAPSMLPNNIKHQMSVHHEIRHSVLVLFAVVSAVWRSATFFILRAKRQRRTSDDASPHISIKLATFCFPFVQLSTTADNSDVSMHSERRTDLI